MPILGDTVRQVVILRTGDVFHVAVLRDPKVMVQVAYDDAFTLDKIDDAFNAAYQALLYTEQKA